MIFYIQWQLSAHCLGYNLTRISSFSLWSSVSWHNLLNKFVLNVLVFVTILKCYIFATEHPRHTMFCVGILKGMRINCDFLIHFDQEAQETQDHPLSVSVFYKVLWVCVCVSFEASKKCWLTLYIYLNILLQSALFFSSDLNFTKSLLAEFLNLITKKKCIQSLHVGKLTSFAALNYSLIVNWKVRHIVKL